MFGLRREQQSDKHKHKFSYTMTMGGWVIVRCSICGYSDLA